MIFVIFGNLEVDKTVNRYYGSSLWFFSSSISNIRTSLSMYKNMNGNIWTLHVFLLVGVDPCGCLGTFLAILIGNYVNVKARAGTLLKKLGYTLYSIIIFQSINNPCLRVNLMIAALLISPILPILSNSLNNKHDLHWFDNPRFFFHLASPQHSKHVNSQLRNHVPKQLSKHCWHRANASNLSFSSTSLHPQSTLTVCALFHKGDSKASTGTRDLQ